MTIHLASKARETSSRLYHVLRGTVLLAESFVWRRKYEQKGFGYTSILNGSFAEYAANPLFGVDVEKATFEFFGPKEKRHAFTGARDIAKYTVASVLLLESHPSTEACRTFRIPIATHSCEEVIEILSRVQGKKYTSTYRPYAEVLALAAKYAAECDVENGLIYSLKAILGDGKLESVPKPWDHDQFPGIVPEGLEVCLRRQFGQQG